MKYQFIITVEGYADKQSAMVLAQDAISQKGIASGYGNSVSLKIKQDGVTVSHEEIDGHGIHSILIPGKSKFKM